MRYLVPIVLTVGLVGCATPKQTPKALNDHQGQLMTVRTTAYTQSEAGGKKNAVDGRLHFGTGAEYSAASDWSWLPLGTRFKLLSTNQNYVIEDYGAALVGRQTIDLYFPKRSQVHGWGVRNEPIQIVEWGSEAMSLKLLAPRCKNRHVATMVAQLKKQGVVPPSSDSAQPATRVALR